MADPAWPSLSPETNYLRLAGPGAGGTATTMASGAAWQALMGSNELAFSLSMLNTAVTALNFEGIGGLSSRTAVTGLNTALQLLAGWVQAKPPIAASAVSAYQTAVSAMIPAEVSIANRTQQASHVAINPAVLGALTPAIVALDTEYGEHWPHNAGAGAAYGAALSALVAALAVPPPIAPAGASPAAPATAAAAVAQAAGTTGMQTAQQSGQVAQLAGQTAAAPAQAGGGLGQLSSMTMQPMQAATGGFQPLMGMFSAPQAVQGFSSLPQSMMGSLGGVFKGMKAGDAAVPATELVKAGPPIGTGAGGGGGGGLPGGGLTSYTRPTNSFAPEHSGRPTSLKTGLLSAAEMRGPTAAGMGGGAMPIPPANAGMLAHAKADNSKYDVDHARIVVDRNPRLDPRLS
jgi:hypothetical protein